MRRIELFVAILSAALLVDFRAWFKTGGPRVTLFRGRQMASFGVTPGNNNT